MLTASFQVAVLRYVSKKTRRVTPVVPTLADLCLDCQAPCLTTGNISAIIRTDLLDTEFAVL
jgi:hypothetical protein